VNIAQWEQAQDHIRVVTSPQFGAHVQALAKVATSDPDLYAPVLEVEHAQA
jgi:hypothetical protein